MNAGLDISATAIEAALRQALAPTRLEVLDESAAHAGHAGANGTGFGTHFRVRIGGPAFVGKSRLAQHRLVYDALQKFTAAGLHALAIEVRSPDPGTRIAAGTFCHPLPETPAAAAALNPIPSFKAPA